MSTFFFFSSCVACASVLRQQCAAMVGLSNDQLTSGELEAYTKKVCAGQPKGFPFDCDVNDIMVPDDAGDLGYTSDDDEVDEEEIQTVSGFECVIGENLWT